MISVAHFSCLKFFAKNEKNEAIFREKRKNNEKFFLLGTLQYKFKKNGQIHDKFAMMDFN